MLHLALKRQNFEQFFVVEKLCKISLDPDLEPEQEPEPEPESESKLSLSSYRNPSQAFNMESQRRPSLYPPSIFFSVLCTYV
jgi:hypothetical protein